MISCFTFESRIIFFDNLRCFQSRVFKMIDWTLVRVSGSGGGVGGCGERIEQIIENSCFFFRLCLEIAYSSFQDAMHITAILGESVVFNCPVEFPGDHPVPYVLQWEKKVGDSVCTTLFSHEFMFILRLQLCQFLFLLFYFLSYI